MSLSFKQFLELSEAELKHMTAPLNALKSKPDLIDKENPLSRDSYEYRKKWHGKPGTRAGSEHHEIKRDVANNHKRIEKARATPNTFRPLKNYLSARPPRG